MEISSDVKQPSKFISRKFVMSLVVIGLSTIVPIAYKLFGIDDATTMVVLGLYGSVGAVYGVVNTLNKKYGGEG